MKRSSQRSTVEPRLPRPVTQPALARARGGATAIEYGLLLTAPALPPTSPAS